ncbi:MAG: DsbA family protein, partial [Nannocystaceae bacterium]
MSSRADLVFYFDFISPYAYLAFPEVLRLCENHQRTMIPTPVVFGAILTHHGHLGPAEIPSKRAYTFKHVLRLAHERGRDLTPPPGHPFNSLLALRM